MTEGLRACLCPCISDLHKRARYLPGIAVRLFMVPKSLRCRMSPEKTPENKDGGKKAYEKKVDEVIRKLAERLSQDMDGMESDDEEMPEINEPDLRAMIFETVMSVLEEEMPRFGGTFINSEEEMEKLTDESGNLVLN